MCKLKKKTSFQINRLERDDSPSNYSQTKQDIISNASPYSYYSQVLSKMHKTPEYGVTSVIKYVVIRSTNNLS